MNERIKELAEQAGFTVEDGHIQSLAGKRAEKFAELIVREYSYDCMDVTSNSEHIRFVAKKWGVEL